MSSRWDEPPSHLTSPLDLVGTSTAETVWAPSTKPDEVSVELIGFALRVVGKMDMRHTLRLSDHVNNLEGFFRLRDVTLLDRTGKPTRVCLPDLRVRLDDIVIVARGEQADPGAPPDHALVAKQARHITVMTVAHIVYGRAWLHEQASLANFIDSPDPRFMPMTDVRVRWLTDRRLAGRYPFALVSRRHIIGVSSESKGHHDAQQAQAEPAGSTQGFLGGGFR